ncbi:MAG: HyaD/HybD family hydrogenase maturation endopeptidase [Sulfuricurvum sp.]|nr:HyaD/HybD family hydrogenase maturation endopeptidase [Sulfuricurvum sp.]MDP3023571.1 HyaD/HybD family hydrogenase maturation endopeptidase [Sulfuricurvum sp.]
MNSIAVIGVGNILFCDDGVGVYAARYLETNYDFEPPIDIIDGGTLGFNLMRYFSDYDQVIILDTLSINETAGTIYRLPSDALLGLGDMRKTVHEVEVTQMIELASLMDVRASISVLGIIPSDIETVAMDLSPIVKEHFGAFIQTLLGVLKEAGVSATQKDHATSLGAIVQGSYRFIL